MPFLTTFYILLIIILTTLDQLSKYWIVKSEVTIHITNFFKLELATNTGIAFSFPIPQFIIIPLSIIVSIFLLHLIFNSKTQKQESIAYCLIVSGAFGNLIDRLLHGYVIDFLSFWSFPIFNIADSCISIGIVLLIITEIKKSLVQKLL